MPYPYPKTNWPYPFNVLYGGVSTEYAYQLDGLTQQFALSKTYVLSGNFSYQFDGSFSANGFSIVASNSGRMHINSGRAVHINSVFIGTLSSESWAILTNGATHRIIVARTPTAIEVTIDGARQSFSRQSESFAISRLGGNWDAATSIPRFSGKFYNFKLSIEGVQVLNIPLNNKGTGATQATSPPSAVNATIVNYNENGWVQL